MVAYGADCVSGWAEKITDMVKTKNPKDLPHALVNFEQIQKALHGRKPLLILHYDGTLSPIAPNADEAVLPEATQRPRVELAKLTPVAVISGRDRKDVENKVNLKQLIYAGSHGLDMVGPEGLDIPQQIDINILRSLQTAAENLNTR